jgi:enamine deaminase RidA (YjgF/YER057c/UK114 family)
MGGQRLSPEELFKPAAYAQVVAALPASTLVGVQALAEPGYLVEVEAIAVADQA